MAPVVEAGDARCRRLVVPHRSADICGRPFLPCPAASTTCWRGSIRLTLGSLLCGLGTALLLFGLWVSRGRA